MTFTRRLAHFVGEGISFDSLPPQVIAQSKEMMINAAAVGLAGAAQDQGRTLAALFQDMGANGRCTIIGLGLRTSPVNAAMVNGLLVHLLDFDDEIQGVVTHPTAVIFPAVMALAELNGNSGREVLTAFALGCETAAKLDIWSHSSFLQNVHRPFSGGMAGGMGAAAAAGHLLGLDEEQMETALGIAARQAHGPLVEFDSPGGALQCGQAAMAGLTAAMLAQRGFESGLHSDYPFDSPLKLVDPGTAVVPAPDQEAFFDTLANPYSVVDPGLTVKLYPCASASHTVVDAVLQLMQQHRIEASQIEAVKVCVTPAALRALPYQEPQDPSQARSSLTYITAQTLLNGQPLIEQFSPSALQDPRGKGVDGTYHGNRRGNPHSHGGPPGHGDRPAVGMPGVGATGGIRQRRTPIPLGPGGAKRQIPLLRPAHNDPRTTSRELSISSATWRTSKTPPAWRPF